MTEVDRSDHPKVQPLTLFYTISERNGTTFTYLRSIENLIPFNCYKYSLY